MTTENLIAHGKCRKCVLLRDMGMFSDTEPGGRFNRKVQLLQYIAANLEESKQTACGKTH